MSTEKNDCSSVHRLEASKPSDKGGLVIMKKQTMDKEESGSFKKPLARPSVLGLDRLAALKRTHNLEELAEKQLVMSRSHVSTTSGVEKDVVDKLQNVARKGR